MNKYIISIWCDRLGGEVKETVIHKQGSTIFQVAEEEHKGQCGNRNNPCDAEAMETGHSIQKVSE